MIGVPTPKLVGKNNDVLFYLKPINQAIPVLNDALATGDNPDLPSPSTPAPTPGNPVYGEGISIYGRIIDSFTFDPIPGAAFVVLQSGVSVYDFLNDPQDNMILAYGEADRDGLFICDYIPGGGSYSVIVVADGYMPIMEDDAIVLPDGWAEDIDLGDIYLEIDW